MALRIGIIVAIVLVIGYFMFGRRSGVTGSDAHQMVEAGARLVDVRTPEEFAAGHIAGAINLPVQEFDRRMAELEPKDRPIVLYCRSGNRSGRAARMLESAGYTAVHDLGAMSRW